MKLKLDEIIKDPDIYPRVQISQKTIGSYIEAKRAGAIFPPIEVQKISVDGEVKVVSLDGWHRLEAVRGYNKLDGVKKIEEIECKAWKDGTLDKGKYLVELMVRSFELNAKQGLRPSQTDAKYQLEKIAQTPDALSIVWKEIAKAFEVTPQWVSECVAPILAEKRMSRDAFIYKLHLLGWTQEEIGELSDPPITKQAVGQRVKEIKQLEDALLLDFYDKRKKVEDIAEYYHMNIPLVWAILLEGKDDIERFKLFGDSEYGDDQPKLIDYWKFNQRDPRLGQADYPGNLYGQEVLNILYRYSKQGDFVVDLMAGGAVTVDACLVMKRKCRAYDKHPYKSGRNDITEWDITKGLPDKVKNCSLVILDPPYYKKKETDYGIEFTKDRETFLSNIANIVRISHEMMPANSYFALVYGQYIDYEDELKSILSSDLCRIFEDSGFRSVCRFQSPLTFDIQYKPFEVDRAKEFTPWRILPVSKDWQIFYRRP